MIATRAKVTISLTIVSIVLGFMVALQYQQVETRRQSGDDLSAVDVEVRRLQSQLQALKSANGEAQTELARLTNELSSYETKSAGNNRALQGLQQRLDEERILSGMTPVTGPGISITLMDGQGPNTEQVLTHDWDVRQVINEIFTAGAEAVSINGYRVVATSGIYCTGPVVRINDHRIGAPFLIQAIGDPQALQSALNISGGILDALRQRGVDASDPQIEKSITMPAFTSSATASSTQSPSA